MKTTIKILAIFVFAALLLPQVASAATKLTGTASWKARAIGPQKLTGKLALGQGSSYQGNQGSVNLQGSLRGKKVRISAIKLQGKNLSGKIGKKRITWARVQGARGSLFSYSVQAPAKLTRAGARTLRRAGWKKAKGGRAAGTVRVQGDAIHKIKSGTATITFNATLVNQFQYLVNPTDDTFASFAGLAVALPLGSNGLFQTVYAEQLSGDPTFLDGKISTPLILNPNCVDAPAGSGPDALPNDIGASCAPASGITGSEIEFPATGGELVGGQMPDEITHAGGLGLQLRLGSASLPLGGPDYGSLTPAAGNGIGGSVLRDPAIDQIAGADNLVMSTSLGRLPIATLPGWGSTVACDPLADEDGNYTCTASADTLLTGVAAGALSASFNTTIPANTNLGSMATEFKIGN